MQYRRARTDGGSYFFTLITHKRRRILAIPENVTLLRDAFIFVMQKYPFFTDAAVILPDHVHCIWSLPKNDHDYSTRWRLIKSFFTRKCDGKYKLVPSASREKKKEQAIWQRRFWEHQLLDQRDFNAHVDYIHYNPVKHGLTKAPKDWEYSSFNRYVNDGKYESNWGAGQDIIFAPTIGKE